MNDNETTARSIAYFSVATRLARDAMTPGAVWLNEIMETMSHRQAEAMESMTLYGHPHKGKAPGVRSTR
jgi:hypothetical protein